jgi:hypothetical protein
MQGAAVRLRFQRATDAWSKKDIENNWDILKKWTDAAGPAALLIGSFMLSQEKSGSSSDMAAALIGSGAGLILLGNLGTLGQLYGGVNDKHRARVAQKTIDALQDIEASREAYENSLLIFGLLDSYRNKAEQLLSVMEALASDARNLLHAAPSPDTSMKLAALCDSIRATVSVFKDTAVLTDEYAKQLQQLYEKYREEVCLPGDKKKIEDAQTRVREFRAAYAEIIGPFLEGVPEVVEAMLNIKTAVISNSIADKQYF